jgi:hypothetical protein
MRLLAMRVRMNPSSDHFGSLIDGLGSLMPIMERSIDEEYCINSLGILVASSVHVVLHRFVGTHYLTGFSDELFCTFPSSSVSTAGAISLP